MESPLVLEFILVMSGDNSDEVSRTLASLRQQTSSAWTARVIYDQDMNRDQVEAMTGKNPRITFERIGSLGTLSPSRFEYTVFVPNGSVLDDDAVEYLENLASTTSPSVALATGRQNDNMVMVAKAPNVRNGAPTFIYQRRLFTRADQDLPRQRDNVGSVIEVTYAPGSLKDLVIEKTRQINDLEGLLHRKDHDLLGIRNHLASVQEANRSLQEAHDLIDSVNQELKSANAGLSDANAGLNEANNGLNAANDELNQINQTLIGELSNRGLRGLLRRMRK